MPNGISCGHCRRGIGSGFCHEGDKARRVREWGKAGEQLLWLMFKESEQLGGQLVPEEDHGQWHSGEAIEGGNGCSREVWGGSGRVREEGRLEVV